MRLLLGELRGQHLEIVRLAPDVMCLVVGGARAERRFTSNEWQALTEAERAVVALVLDSLSNDEIAARRRASESTVANQLTSAYRKLGVHGRRELIARYSERDVLRPERAGA